MKLHHSIKIVFIGVWMFVSGAGLFLAQRKPLWADEVWTQVATVEKFSYWEMLSGQMKNKGGNMYPLPVMIQKVFCDIAGFHSPESWKEHNNHFIEDRYAMGFLRFPSVLFMSSAVAGIVCFSFVQGGLLSAAIALVLFVSSYMAVQYLVEARFYALWFLLSSWQIITLINIFKERDGSKPQHYLVLAIVNLLLSLTVVFSVVQVGVAAALMGFLHKRNIRYQILGTIIPLVIALFYYFSIENPLKFWFPRNSMDFIWICYPWEVASFFLLFTGSTIYFFNLRKASRAKNTQSIADYFRQDENLFQAGALILMASMFFAAAFVELIWFKTKAVPRDVANFALYPRYFFYLTPLSMILTPMFIQQMISRLKHQPWMLAHLGVIVVGLLGMNFLKSWAMLLRYTYYWDI